MRTILIVEDQTSVLAALEYIFSSNGFAVIVADSGPAALAKAESQPIDAALIDLHMPKMDGVAVCRSLCDRARSEGRVLPVWIMAAAYTVEAAGRAVEAGARSLLKKPFDYSELFAEIESCLAGEPPRRSDPPPTRPAAPAETDSDREVA